MNSILFAGFMAAAVVSGPSLTAAEEDGYFDLDRTFVEGQSRLDVFSLDTPPDPVGNCARAEALVAHDRTRIEALSQYLVALQARGRTIDSLLPFYLVASAGADDDAARRSLDCAYDGKRSDINALEYHVHSLIDAVPPEAAADPSHDLAGLRAVMTRDVLLDAAVSATEMLRDAGATSPSAKALITRLPALKAEQAAAHRMRIRRLGPYETAPANDELMRRQILRAPTP